MKSRRRWWVNGPYIITNVAIGYLINMLTDSTKPLVPLLAVTVILVGLFIFLERLRDGSRPPPRRRSRPGIAALVARPTQVDELVAHLLAPPRGPSGVCVGLYGPGGFGKTTLAEMVVNDPRVQQRFRRSHYWLTLGEDLPDAEFAAKLNDLAESITGERPGFIRPEEAGYHLGAILDRRKPTLLVIDDVWHEDHLRPFIRHGRSCTRLITTRQPDLIPPGAKRIEVATMTAEQARAVIAMDVPDLPADLLDALVAQTGRWPLLLALVNGRLRRAAHTDDDVASLARAILTRLRETGPAALDMRVNAHRSRAVRATIESSLNHLPSLGGQRAAELGIFAEDEPIPVAVAAALWRVTGALPDAATTDLIESLAELSLIRIVGHGEQIQLHRVIRKYLRFELGAAGLRRTNQALLSTVDELVGGGQQWWRLPHTQEYLWRHLPQHVADADHDTAREDLVTSLRWVGAKLRVLGPESVAADLADVAAVPAPIGSHLVPANRIDSAHTSASPSAATSGNGPQRTADRARRLLHTIGQSTHLLTPTSPPDSLTHIFLNQLRDDPRWRREAALADAEAGPGLANVWPLPDPFDPAMIRVFDDIGGLACTALGVSVHGGVLAAADRDGVVYLWHDGAVQATAAIPTGMAPITAIAVADDGGWFATAGQGRAVRVWHSRTGARLATLEDHDGAVYGLVLAGERFLISTCADRAVRVWDTDTWHCRRVLPGHTAPVARACACGDGSLVATYSLDGTIRLWTLSTGASMVLASALADVHAMSFSPDATFLTVVSSRDGRLSVTVWNRLDGSRRADFPLPALATLPAVVSAQGDWVATAGRDQHVRLWGVEDPACLATFTGHTAKITAIAVTGGQRVVTGSADGTVRLWDSAIPTGAGAAADPGRREPAWAVAAAADGAWLGVGLDDHRVMVWDMAAGTTRAILSAHDDRVIALAAAPGGMRLVSGANDRSVRVWDVRLGQQVGEPKRHQSRIDTVAVAADCAWFATAGFDGIVRVWTLPQHRPIHQLRTGADYVLAMAASANSQLLVAADSNHLIHVWSTDDWTVLHTLAGHRDWVKAVAISPDATMLGSGGNDMEVRLWEAGSGQLRYVFTGHRGMVNGVAFSHDGRYLASVSEDRDIRVWDVFDHSCVAMTRVTAAVRACVWLPNRRLAAVGAAGTYVFHLRIEEKHIDRPE